MSQSPTVTVQPAAPKPGRWDQHPLGRPLLIALTYNNGKHALSFLEKIPAERSFDVLLHDDHSTDDTLEYLSRFQFPCLRAERNRGIGGSIKSAIRYASQRGYRVVAIAAANGKDDPRQVEALLEPIYAEGFDYVQGSRRLRGGSSENLPWFRRIMLPVHAFLFTLCTGRRCSDSLNGFRAYKLDLVFNEPSINVWQDWLDRYEYETYLHYKVLTNGFRFKEIPVSKTYTQFRKGERYSHIRPFVDWWSNLRPLVYLFLGLRR